MLLGVALASSAQAQVINTPGQTIYTFTSPGTVEDTGLVVGRNQGGLVWIYGMRSDDGNFGGGSLFRLQVTGTDFEVLHHFGDPATPDVGFNPSGPLVEGATGIFYGTTREGGTDGWGGVFRLDTTVTPPVVTAVRSFSADQGVPHDGVTLASDGMLYGTASSTYATPDVVYRIATDGSGYQQLYAFPGSDTDPADPGRAPRGVIEGSDGLLYGATYNGPDLLRGKVFRVAKDGTQFQVLAEAPGLIIAPPVEIESAGDRWIYVVTADGPGTFPTDAPNGSIFRVLADGSSSERVHTFDPTIFDLGAPPVGRLVRIPGQAGVYGLTSYAGGACINGFGCGSVYRGIGPNPYPLRVFQNNENSLSPQGTPALMPDGRLVIMTAGRFDLTTIEVVNYPATDPLQLTGPSSVVSSLQNYGAATYTFSVAHRNGSTRPLTSLQVYVDTSSALQLSGQTTGNGWSCVQADPQFPQYTCAWAGTLNPGDTTPSHAMTFLVSPHGSFAPDCGLAPTPCVSVRADLVSAGTVLANNTAMTMVTVIHPNTGLPNTAPIANDDAVTVVGADAVVIRVFDNDYSNPVENDVHWADAVSQPAQGVVYPNGDLTFVYVPNAPLTSTDSFQYRLRDTFGASDLATVTLSPPQSFRLSKSFIDLGRVKQGEAATGRLSVFGPASVGGSILLEAVPSAEIAALFQQHGSLHDPASAVFDPDAFWEHWTWDTQQPTWIYYRAPAIHPPGRVSVVRAVFRDVAGNIVGSVVLVGESADPATGPIHALDDHAETSVDTPIAIEVVQNDVGTPGEILYAAVSASCRNHIEVVFDNAACTPVDGTLNVDAVASVGQISFAPAAGFTGATAFAYGSADLPACWGSIGCRHETTVYWGVVTVQVGGATPPNLVASKTILGAGGNPVSMIEAHYQDMVRFRIGAINQPPANSAAVGPTTGPVTITDALPVGLTFLPAQSDARCVASGQVVTCTSALVLNQGDAVTFDIAATVAADPDPGNSVALYNNAVASTAAEITTNDNISPDVQVMVRGPVFVDLALTIVPGALSVPAGVPITVAATITNEGSNAASNVVFNGFETLTGFDQVTVAPAANCPVPPPGAPVVCTFPFLNAQESQVITLTATPRTENPAVTVTGSVTAVEADPDTANNSASAVFSVGERRADLATTLTATPASLLVGETLTVTATVTNNGPSAATEVTLRGLAALVSDFSVQSVVTSQGQCGLNASGTQMSCTLPNMTAGSSVTVTVTAVLMGRIFDGTPDTQRTVTLDATASTITTDTNPANDSATTPITLIRPQADVAVSLAASSASVAIGQALTATATIVNHGPQPATGVTLLGLFPETNFTNVTVTSSQGSCSVVAVPTPRVTCTLGTLAPGDSAVVSYTGTPVSSAASESLAAEIARAELDPDGSNDRASATFAVTNTPTGPAVTVPVTTSTGAPAPVTVTFSSVTGSGQTVADPITTPPPVPSGFQIASLAYDISTTAAFTPPVTVCIDGTFGASDVLLHYEGGVWVPLPNQQRLPAGGPPFARVCADTATFSPFVVATRINRAPTVEAGPNQTLEATSAAGAPVTVGGTASDPDGDALTYTWSGACGAANGATTTLACPMGTNVVVLSVSDGHGTAVTDTLTVTVQDSIAPTITIASPGDGATFSVGQAVVATYACADGGTGVQSCLGTLANGVAIPTDTPGTYTFAVDAADAAGNTARTTVSYTVAARTFAFTGFLWPVQNVPVVNKVKAGSAIPVRFGLGGNYGLDVFAPGFPQVVQVACGTGLPEGEVQETVTAGKSGLVYNPLTKRYIYIWKTQKEMAGACWQLTLRFTDGTNASALFKMKK